MTSDGMTERRLTAGSTGGRADVPRRRRRPGAHWARVPRRSPATVIVLDQLTKAWLLANVSLGEVVQVVGDSSGSSTARTAGALFGLFRDQAILFGIVSIGVLGLIVAYHGRAGRSLYLSVALGLLLGGAIGNLIDRFRHGLRRRLGRHRHRRPAVLDLQRRRLGDHASADPACSSALALFPALGRGGRPRAGRPMPEAPRSSPASGPSAVPDGRRGRVDRFVADATGLSRSYVQKLISDGRLTADGERAQGQHDRRQPGRSCASTSAEPDALDLAPAPDITLTVVYEDDDLLIVDKPAGLVVHPAPGHAGGHAGQRAARPRRRRRVRRDRRRRSGRASSIASTATRAGC